MFSQSLEDDRKYTPRGDPRSVDPRRRTERAEGDSIAGPKFSQCPRSRFRDIASAVRRTISKPAHQLRLRQIHKRRKPQAEGATRKRPRPNPQKGSERKDAPSKESESRSPPPYRLTAKGMIRRNAMRRTI